MSQHEPAAGVTVRPIPIAEQLSRMLTKVAAARAEYNLVSVISGLVNVPMQLPILARIDTILELGHKAIGLGDPGMMEACIAQAYGLFEKPKTPENAP
jgi:hypothetical protein